MLKSMAMQEIQTKHHKKNCKSGKCTENNKLGRLRARHKMFKTNKTKNRMRIKEADKYSNRKLYIRDLKRYQVQKNNKVPVTLKKKVSSYNKLKKNHVLNRNKVYGTIINNSTVYLFGKRYHLN